MGRKPLALLTAASLLSGCYSFSGPAPVVNSYGVVPYDALRARRGDYYERFRQAATRASGCEPVERTAPLPARLQCPAAPGQADDDELLRDYMRAGFLLILAECDDYFAHMSRNQGRSRLLRDSITPIANLITGLVALRGNTAGGIPELVLGTSAATATLDIFDQRFLFGAENINAVTDLVINALGAQANAALAMSGLSFEQASAQIIRNQRICTPSSILTLTRQSIQSAVPQAVTPPATGAAPPPAGAAAPPPPPPPPLPPPGAGQSMSTSSVNVPPR